jgi:PAS domain S-box-containing protein
LREIYEKGQALDKMAETMETQGTERGPIREFLREGGNPYRSIFVHSHTGTLLTAPNGRIFDANPEACRIFRYSKEELIRHGRSLIADESDPRLTAALEEQKRTGIFEGQLISSERVDSNFR